MAEEFEGQVFALVVLNSRDREARAQDMNALRRFTRQSLPLLGAPGYAG